MRILGNFLMYFVMMAVQGTAMLLFANPESRRPHFRLRCGAGLAACAVFDFAVRDAWNGPYQSWLSTGMFLLTIAWYLFCCKDQPLRAAYNIFSGILVRLAASSFVNFPLLLLPDWDMGYGFNWIIMPLAHLLGGLLLLLLLDRIMIRDVRRNREFAPSPVQMLVMLLLVTSFLAYLGYTQNGIPLLLFYGARGGFCLLLLILFYLAWRQARTLVQNALEKRIDEEKLRHYADLGDVIRTMNIKAHDLRHQIRTLETGSVVTEQVITELTDAVTNYEHYIRTGNDALDVLLTDAMLRCQRAKIDADFRVDGACLAFMEITDLNALFGNAIDNAIGYLSSLAEADRLFWIVCGQSGGFIRLRFENRLLTPITMTEGGTPQTTNADTFSHGFGTQSIRAIAEKYGGSAAFSTADEVFSVCVVLPAPDAPDLRLPIAQVDDVRT